MVYKFRRLGMSDALAVAFVHSLGLCVSLKPVSFFSVFSHHRRFRLLPIVCVLINQASKAHMDLFVL